MKFLKKIFKEDLASKVLQLLNELLTFYAAWLAGTYLNSFIVFILAFNLLMILNYMIALPKDFLDKIHKGISLTEASKPSESQMYTAISINFGICVLQKLLLFA